MSGDIALMAYPDYADIAQKSQNAHVPIVAYCDYDYPLATITFWPVPTYDWSIVVFSEKPHETPALPNAELIFPKEFLRMLRYNLAVEIAPELGIEPSDQVREIAAQTLATMGKRTRKQDTAQ